NHFEERLRVRAVKALLYREPAAVVRPLITEILGENGARSSVGFRIGVLDALGRSADPELAPVLLDVLLRLPVELKPRALELLIQRPVWSKALLAAIAARRISSSMLSVNQLRRLLESKDPEIASRAKALLGTVRAGRNPDREQVVARMRRLIRATPGDPVAGQAVFAKVCGQCHKIYGQGQDVGPDLTANGRSDFEQLLTSVFDPSLLIGPGYHGTTIATT